MSADPAVERSDLGAGRPQLVFIASGELDVATGPLLCSALRRLVGMGYAHLVVDMSHVTFMDCSGLAAILEARHTARAANGSLTVTNVADELRRVFALTGDGVIS